MNLLEKSWRIESLSSLRFLFFVFIFLSHYKWDGDTLFPAGGSMGVSFFFLLSGFALSMGYGDKIQDLDFRSFFKRRIIKVYPMHFATLLFRVVTFLIIPLLLGEEVCKKVIALMLNVFLLQAWIPDEDIIFSYNTIAWFLCPIMFFYLLFPFLYKLIERVRLIWFVTALVLVYYMAAQLIPLNMIQNILYVSPIFRAFDFMLGIVTYKVFKLFLSKIDIDGEKKHWLPYLFETIICAIIVATILIQPTIGPKWQTASYYWLPLILIILFVSVSERKVGGAFYQKRCSRNLGVLATRCI